MYTTKKAAQLAGIGRSTIPHYAKEWADYLGEAARVENTTRYFTDADIAVFRSVKVLRDQHMATEDIIAYLDDGGRAEAPESPPDAPKSAPGTISGPPALADMLDRFIVLYEARIDDLEGKLDESEAARRLAEVEAAQLRGRLEELERPPRWQFWRK